jgi:hypothetical protein
MITKELAATFYKGKTLYHKTRKNADGTAKRCRVNGKLKVWKTRPSDWQLPVKHGLWDFFYLAPMNAGEWTLNDVTEKLAA